MNQNKYKKYQRRIIASAAVLAVILIFVVIYANTDNVPTLKEISPDNTKISNSFVRVLDVGQGDSILLSSLGRTALIDTGMVSSADVLCGKIKNENIKKLGAVLLTHNHDDHIGGAEDLANRFSIVNLILPDLKNTSSKTRIVDATKQEVLASEGEVYTAKRGMYMNIGDIKLTVLACYYNENDENDRSVVTVAEIEGIKFLFMGDAGTHVESNMLSENIVPDCDVLKAGHHGSSASSGEVFLRRCAPEYVAISCGKDNQYSHPHEEALKRFEKIGAEVLRTDISGDITFFVDNGKFNIVTEK